MMRHRSGKQNRRHSRIADAVRANIDAPRLSARRRRNSLRHVSADAPRRYQCRLQTARRDLRRIVDDMLP